MANAALVALVRCWYIERLPESSPRANYTLEVLVSAQPVAKRAQHLQIGAPAFAYSVIYASPTSAHHVAAQQQSDAFV